MSIFLKGSWEPVARIDTGLWSLDHIVLNDSEGTGMPMRSFIELYGFPESGKSSLAYYISGMVAQQGTICIADLEANCNPVFVERSVASTNFDGTIELLDYKDKKGGLISHEKILKDLALKLKDESVGCLILDSIGVITPTPERESKGYGQARMGMRGKVMADWSRDVLAWLRASQRPKLIIGVNHALSPLGGQGYVAPGGDTKNYIANVRMRMWRTEVFKEGIFVSKVVATKLKYGGVSKRRVGLVAIIPEWGVSRDLSAMFDCFELGLADRSTTVKIGKKSLGYLEKVLFKAALDGDHKKFEPFHEQLADLDMENLYGDEDEESE
jgi:RecA/RadA recombinase